MAAVRPIDLIIIGTGSIGMRHFTSVVACPDAYLHAVVDPSPSAEALAAKYYVRSFRAIEECLKAIKLPDAAILASMCSWKSISSTAAEGIKLIETARASEKQLLTGHHRRFNPYVRAAKSVLSSGQTGRPIAVSGLWTLYQPLDYFQSPYNWRAEAAGSGVVAINLCHEIDTLQYMLGSIRRVHAEQTISHRDYKVEEGAAILLKFASGVVGTFILFDATPSPHNFESATGENPMIPKAGKDVYRIFGNAGVLSVVDMVLMSYGDGVDKSWCSCLRSQSVAVGTEVPLDEQIKHLVKVVKGEEEPSCSGADGLSAVAVCDVVKRSIATGQAVDL